MKKKKSALSLEGGNRLTSKTEKRRIVNIIYLLEKERREKAKKKRQKVVAKMCQKCVLKIKFLI